MKKRIEISKNERAIYLKLLQQEKRIKDLEEENRILQDLLEKQSLGITNIQKNIASQIKEKLKKNGWED